MLNNIKLLLGITDNTKDNLINLLIQMASDDARVITGNCDVSGLSSIIQKMVVFNYNRLGTEGLESESYSGASYNYSSDYPDNILSALKKFGKLKTL